MSHLLHLIFGCRHRELSRPWTIGGFSYKVCCRCAAILPYDIAILNGKEEYEHKEDHRVSEVSVL